MEEKMFPEIGDRINECEIVDQLGCSKTACVYKVWHPTLGVHRAVKLLKHTANRTEQDRFFNEMQILAQLFNQGLHTVHRVGSWNGLHFFETDFVEGDSLADIIETKSGVHLEPAIAIAIELAEIIAYFNTEPVEIESVKYYGVLHRDIKPANIILSPTRGCRIIDFGIASLATNKSFVTIERGMIPGSMPYLAPEMLSETSASVKADMYSFGVVLYEMFCGKRMFPEQNIYTLIQDRLANRFIPLEKNSSGIPKDILALVAKLTAKSPDDRPFNLKEVVATLQKSLRKLTADSPRTVITRRMTGNSLAPDHRKSVYH